MSGMQRWDPYNTNASVKVYDSTTRALHSNISSGEPHFLVTALRPGLSFLLVTYAANAKGKSNVVELETLMMKVAEKRTGPPALFEFTPVLGIIIGVGLALLLTVMVVMVVMKMRKTTPRRGGDCGGPNDELKGDLENKPLNVGVLVPRVVKEGSSTGDGEDNDPDIIPHKTELMTYQDYDINRVGPGHGGAVSGGETVPTVRTLPRTHNQSPPGGSIVPYVELPLPRDAQPGYQVTATDLCLFAAKRRSVYLSQASPPPPSGSCPTSPHSFSPTTPPNASSPPPPSPAPAHSTFTPPPFASEDEGGNIYAAVLPVRGKTSTPPSQHLYSTISTPSLTHPSEPSQYALPADHITYARPEYRRSAYIPSVSRPEETATIVSRSGRTLPRPRSVSSLSTVLEVPNSALSSRGNIYATTGRRRNNGNQIRGTMGPRPYPNALNRRSLQSPPDLPTGVTPRTPLLTSPTGLSHAPKVTHASIHTPTDFSSHQYTPRRPIVTSRSLLRIPTESAV